jgi:hypothetical protein
VGLVIERRSRKRESDVAGIGSATATELAAELGEGAKRLFETGLWYPGAALVRQIIVPCGSPGRPR